MVPLIIKPRLALAAGILTLPTLYFISIAILKYNFGQSYLFDRATPMLEHLGIKEKLGWNINLLILFGPVLAFMLNVLSVLKIQFRFRKEQLDCSMSIRKNWWNLAIIILSTLILVVLFAYLIGENCSC